MLTHYFSLSGGFGSTLMLALLVLVCALVLLVLIQLRNECIRRLSLWAPKQVQKLLARLRSRSGP